MTDPSKKFTIGIISLILFSFLGVVLGVVPLVGDITRNSEQLETRKAELVFAEQMQEHVREFQKLSSEHEEDFARFDNLLIDPDFPVEFIQFLEQTGEESGISVQIGLSAAKKEKGDVWPSSAMVLSGRGAYADFLTLLGRLEQAPHLIKVQKVDIQKDPRGGVTFSLGIKVFTQ